MSRRQALTVILLISVLLIGTVATVIVIKKRSSAVELGVESYVVTNRADFSLSITERDTPAQGLLTIDGDCSEKSIPANNGIFNCTLSSTEPYLAIRGITYTSLTLKKSYHIPILGSGTTDPDPLLLAPDSTLKISADIDVNEKISLGVLKDATIVPIDPELGVILDE